MNKPTSIILSCVAALVLFSTSANAAPFTNGGFEQPGGVSGWDYFNYNEVDGWKGSNIEIWQSGLNGVTSYEGAQHAELNSHGDTAPFTIFQEFDTVIGQTYQVSFAYRARTGSTSSSDESFLFGFVDNESEIGTGGFTMDDHVVGTWSTFTDTFVANSASSIIYFKSLAPTGTLGNFIDGVSVTAVPVPAAVWLFGSALVGLVTFGRRGKV